MNSSLGRTVCLVNIRGADRPPYLSGFGVEVRHLIEGSHE